MPYTDTEAFTMYQSRCSMFGRQKWLRQSPHIPSFDFSCCLNHLVHENKSLCPGAAIGSDREDSQAKPQRGGNAHSCNMAALKVPIAEKSGIAY